MRRRTPSGLAPAVLLALACLLLWAAGHEALAQAVTASRARLDATRLGRQVGDRTTLDLLNAENDVAGSELALLQARVGVLMDRLKLAALAGRLDEARLQSVSDSLQAPGAR